MKISLMFVVDHHPCRVGKGGRGVTLSARRVFRRAHRGVAGGHGGSGAVDESIGRGRLCPPYRPRIVSKAAYDSNFGIAGLGARF
jgi:hypothetical protein